MSEGPRYQRAVVEVEFGGTYHLLYVFWRLLQATPNSIPGLQKIMFLRKISIEPSCRELADVTDMGMGQNPGT